MKNLFKSTVKDRVYTYIIEGDTVTVLYPEGTRFISASKDPNGGVWDDAAKEAWAINLTNTYNKTYVEGLYESKLAELNEVYMNANLGRVILSDGNVFSASYEIGENPSKSLSNTRRLIKDAVELSIYDKKTSVTLSDADNNDVIYPIEYNADGVGSYYIKPVVEIGRYEGLFFELKRTIRNNIMLICSVAKLAAGDEIDVDALYSIDPAKTFQTLREEYEAAANAVTE